MIPWFAMETPDWRRRLAVPDLGIRRRPTEPLALGRGRFVKAVVARLATTRQEYYFPESYDFDTRAYCTAGKRSYGDALAALGARRESDRWEGHRDVNQCAMLWVEPMRRSNFCYVKKRFLQCFVV